MQIRLFPPRLGPDQRPGPVQLDRNRRETRCASKPAPGGSEARYRPERPGEAGSDPDQGGSTPRSPPVPVPVRFGVPDLSAALNRFSGSAAELRMRRAARDEADIRIGAGAS